MDMEFLAYLDQEKAGAREWFVDCMENSPGSLAVITTACAADDANVLRKLAPEFLDCIQRLAILKLHELAQQYAAEHPERIA